MQNVIFYINQIKANKAKNKNLTMYKVYNTVTKEYITNLATFEHCIYTKEQAKELARTYTQLTRKKHTVILIK